MFGIVLIVVLRVVEWRMVWCEVNNFCWVRFLFLGFVVMVFLIWFLIVSRIFGMVNKLMIMGSRLMLV